LKTDTNGEAELTFTPEREGYYRVAWAGQDVLTNRPSQPINADTTVWVANNSTSELGYRTGGVEIIADKDTFHVGGVRAGDAGPRRPPGVRAVHRRG